MSKEISLTLIRGRLCDPIFRPLSASSDSNYSKLKFTVSNSITEGCNNSILLLGPRGSGKSAVLDLVVGDLLEEYPTDSITVEIARQLCMEHHLLFSKMASFDENSQFIIAMLRLLDAMQSVTSQAVVIGISSRLTLVVVDTTTVVQNLIIYNLSPHDTDQLLEKRVRSRFSNRKILFLPPSKEENITSDTRFKDMLRTFLNANSTVNSLLKFIFRAVSSMNLESGLLSLENFKAAVSSMQRQPKLEAVRDCSILELYLLVCMRRLEVKEQSSYNFICVMKEYKTIHDSFQTSDYYTQNVCLRAFEHLREREVICYAENRGQSQTGEYRPMKLLISASELHQGMRSHACCPAILLKLLDH
ncbi:hypothetical protein BRARA_B03017 [Brassica rapa]|uniref:Origin recognition complex subunit 4 C-terminal domain-containing protein n=1 Tax=Brassica campestris TaxID=3711 RepID=A0A398AE19_BRACM|nr:hypothetical protein BRARA_B03017 [Brassica rapa]